MIKAAIFDLDGVMINTDPLTSLVYEFVIKHYGKVPKYNKYGLIHDSGTREEDILQRIKKDYGIKDKIEKLMEKREDFYKELLYDLIPQTYFKNITFT